MSKSTWYKVSLGVVSVCVIVIFLFHEVSMYQPDGLLHVYFLDVGQGDSALIITPEGKKILIDAGPDPLILQRQLEQILPWYDHTIHMLIITHQHMDHFGGYFDLHKKFHPQIVMIAPHLYGNSFHIWLRDIMKSSQVIVGDSTVDFVLENQVILDTLYPLYAPTAKTYKNINNGSLVHRLSYGEFSVLFTGDIEEKGIHILTEIYHEALMSTLMKASHHGSRNGWTHKLYTLVNPDMVTLSYGKNNTYKHPHPETLKILNERDIPYVATAEKGTIHIVSNGDQYWVLNSQ
jgi:competence protein ComEC